MSRALAAMTSQYWAIDPSWIPLMASIAQRGSGNSNLESSREWVKRDHLAMAGPGAQKLAGANRAYVVDGVGVLPITGPIFPRANLLTEVSGATSLTMLQNDHRLLLASKDVRAIMLLLDSPGGAVSGVADFASRVALGAARKETRAFVMGSAASAAYWIASSASHISVDRTAVLGSIGVVAAVPKQVEPDESGELWIEVVSSNAPNKRPDPQSEDGLSVIRGSLNAIEGIFVGDVAKGRKVPTSKVRSEFGQGGVLIGADAVKSGMADKVESKSTAMNALRMSARLGGGQRVAARGSLHISADTQRRANLLRLAALRPRARA